MISLFKGLHESQISEIFEISEISELIIITSNKSGTVN